MFPLGVCETGKARVQRERKGAFNSICKRHVQTAGLRIKWARASMYGV